MLWLPGWSVPLTMWDGIVGPFDSSTPFVACDFSEATRPADHVELASRALDRVGAACVVVGWSLGAMVALELARARPDDIDALVLVAATDRFVAGEDRIGWPARVLARMRARLDDDAAAVIDELDRRMFAANEGDEAAAWIETRQQASLLPFEALDSGLAYLAQVELDGTAVEARTRLLHGRDDVICPAAGAERLARSLPRGELTFWEGVGHVPFWTRPEAFSAWLRVVSER